jgi:hypothetical protein
MYIIAFLTSTKITHFSFTKTWFLFILHAKIYTAILTNHIFFKTYF